MPERIRLRIGNMGRAVLVSGQAYQDPKDALNEFVSNAADEYAESGRHGKRIRIVLRRRGRYPVIAVEDTGRGMDAVRVREIARNLFNSSKVSDPRTIGEKAIGILAFQQLGARCDIVTRPEGSTQTHALRLERGSPRADSN
jgi:anti-sigma regulatory factor (Ser/Thr protein kinase)